MKARQAYTQDREVEDAPGESETLDTEVAVSEKKKLEPLNESPLPAAASANTLSERETKGTRRESMSVVQADIITEPLTI